MTNDQQPMLRLSRFAFSVAAVAAGYGLRLALERWLGGTLPIYITFYPAVMVAALLGGIGPGLVATVVSCWVAGYWILPPVGQFAIGSPVDQFGLALFAGMGLFMSAVAELYRRNRRKAVAQERELALREGREALQRQAELMDPVRAKIIAQEMLRIVRGRSAPAPVPLTDNWMLRLPTVMGLVTAAIGAMVMLGWIVGSEWLTRIAPGLPTMKFNTGFCFLLVGLALVLRERGWWRVTFAVMACTVAVATLVEYATGRDFGIDHVWFHELPDADTIYPGRMVTATVLCFLMSGAALLLLKTRRGQWAYQSLAVLTGILGMIGLVGYVYGVEVMYQFASHASMALHTAVGFTLLAIGLVFARADGLASTLMGNTPGSQAARRFLPVVIPVTLFIGWLHRVLERNQVVSPAVGDCLVVIALLFSFVLMVLWTARVLNRSDEIRREIEGQLRDQAELMNLAKEGLIVRDMDGTIRSWNQGAETLYGWKADEALGQPIHTLLKTGGADLAALSEQLERTGHWEGELAQTTRDGRLLAVESQKTLTRTADGQVLILENNRDITERKQVETALRESEQRIQQALRVSRSFTFEWHPASDQVLRSASCATILGLIGDEAVNDTGQRFFHRIHPDDRARFVRMLEGMSPANADYNVEYRAFCGNGSVVMLEEVGQGIFDASGKLERLVGVTTDITDRKQAEEALRESEERFRLMGDTIPYGAWMADAEGRNIYISPLFLELVGMTFAQVKEFGWTGKMPPEDVEPMMRRWMECVRTGRDWEGEMRFPDSDGRWRTILSRGKPIRDEKGQVKSWIGINLDITERKQAETALRESEQRLALAASGTGIGMFDRNIVTGETLATEPHIRLIGLRTTTTTTTTTTTLSQRYQYRDWTERVHPEDLPRVEAEMARCMTERTPYETEYRVVWPNGSVHWLTTRGVFQYDAQNQPQHLLGIAMDITARKQAEDALRWSEERFKAIASSTQDHILVQDRDLRYTFVVNPQLGLTEQDMLGKTDYDFLTKDDAEKLTQLKRQVLEAGSVVNLEVPLISPTGYTQYFSGAYVPKYDTGGRIDGLIGYFQNITARKQAEEALRASLHEKEVLLKEVHHRVKNNMQVLASLVNLQADNIEDAATREVFNDFRDQVRTMALVHENLYQFENLASIDFAEFARQLTLSLARSHGRGNSDLRLTLDAEPVMLPVESAVPCGLILNELVTNAYKHAFRDRTSGEIVVGVHADSAGRVCLSVRDDGVGLPAGLDWRQSPSLGLRLVQMLARQVHGELDILTDTGTAIHLTFAPPRLKEGRDDTHA